MAARGVQNTVLKELSEFSGSLTVMNGRLKELRRKYPNEFVAIHEGKVVGHGPKIEPLIKELKEEGIDPSKIPIEFISKDPEVLVV